VYESAFLSDRGIDITYRISVTSRTRIYGKLHMAIVRICTVKMCGSDDADVYTDAYFPYCSLFDGDGKATGDEEN
jgi:hypothetical protein